MASVRKTGATAPAAVMTRVFVLGSPLVPEDVASQGLLLEDDYRALALDHIERTSDVIYKLELVKTT